MPFNFSGQSHQSVAKLGVVSDGENITVFTDGYTVTSTLSASSIFAANPSRSAVGTWSIQLKDIATNVIEVDVQPVLSSGYLSVQHRPVTAASPGGQAILHWVFNNAGTPTDLPSNGAFRIFVVYTDVRP